MKALFLIIGAVAFVSAGTVYNGYALSVLWGWFIVTTFAAPSLTVAQAVGVSAVLGALKSNIPKCKDNRDTNEKATDLACAAFLAPTLSLGIGWVVKLFL